MRWVHRGPGRVQDGPARGVDAQENADGQRPPAICCWNCPANPMHDKKVRWKRACVARWVPVLTLIFQPRLYHCVNSSFAWAHLSAQATSVQLVHPLAEQNRRRSSSHLLLLPGLGRNERNEYPVEPRPWCSCRFHMSGGKTWDPRTMWNTY